VIACCCAGFSARLCGVTLRVDGEGTALAVGLGDGEALAVGLGAGVTGVGGGGGGVTWAMSVAKSRCSMS
jgi:hypothetical protein